MGFHPNDLVLVGVFMAMSTCIKMVALEIPTGQVVFFRSFFAIPVILVWLAWSLVSPAVEAQKFSRYDPVSLEAVIEPLDSMGNACGICSDEDLEVDDELDDLLARLHQFGGAVFAIGGGGVHVQVAHRFRYRPRGTADPSGGTTSPRRTPTWHA